MIRSTIVPMYYKDYFVDFAPEPFWVNNHLLAWTIGLLVCTSGLILLLKSIRPLFFLTFSAVMFTWAPLYIVYVSLILVYPAELPPKVLTLGLFSSAKAVNSPELAVHRLRITATGILWFFYLAEIYLSSHVVSNTTLEGNTRRLICRINYLK